jgi:hypothetical protein
MDSELEGVLERKIQKQQNSKKINHIRLSQIVGGSFHEEQFAPMNRFNRPH